VSRENFCSYPCLCLLSLVVNKVERLRDFRPPIKGERFLLCESAFQGERFLGGETLDFGAFANCIEPLASI
jgi:hypothetical protein